MQTRAVEDYLKTIYEVQNEQGKVATSTLAERLGVAPASVTGMVKRLAEMNLVTYTPYQGVALTETGKQIALEVLRHHRLMELYLAQALGVPWDQVHAEAEKWEHVLSDTVEDRIDEALGHPTTDPHGSPIPGKDGSFRRVVQKRLSNLEPGQSGVVSEVPDEDPELLRYLGRMGLYPQVAVDVVGKEPFDGPLTIRVGAAEHILGREAAHQVRVAPSEEAEHGAD